MLTFRKPHGKNIFNHTRQAFYEKYFVARQPVFTASGQCWGYELLFRDSVNLLQAVLPSECIASSEVIIDGLPLVLEDSPDNCKAFINIPVSMLGRGGALALPKKRCVIEILENSEPTTETLRTLAELKRHGYALALDDYTGQPHLKPFLDFVQIVKVDFREVTSASKRLELCTMLKSLGGTKLLLAEKVEDYEEYTFAKKNGYSLFQGYFFQRPELIRSRKVSQHAESTLRTLRILASPDLTGQKLKSIFLCDSALTYRLLKYINSAIWPPHRDITTVDQATTYMGTIPLKKWLMTTTLADMRSNGIKNEVAVRGATRGYFFHWLASRIDKSGEEDAFILGLFSTLDALYDLPFDVLFERVPVNRDVMEALCFRSGRWAAWLDAVEALEAGDIRKSYLILSELGFPDVGSVILKYQESNHVVCSEH